MNAELIAWANEGNRKLEWKLRALGANYFQKRMLSTSATAVFFEGISYTPSTSLPIAVSVNRLTLPPDFLEMKYINGITSGYESISMTYLDHTDPAFQMLLKDTTDRGRGAEMYWDIIGNRTLLWVPRIGTALDIEIGYIGRTQMLGQYSTGTLAITDATDDAVGSSTVWTTLSRYYDASQFDIMWGTSASSTVPTAEPTLVYDDVSMSRVLSIESATALTTAANKQGTLASGTGYQISSVPVVPPEYHHIIADYVTLKILSKAGDPQAQRALMNWPDNVADLQTTAGRRQTADAEHIEDWNPND